MRELIVAQAFLPVIPFGAGLSFRTMGFKIGTFAGTANSSGQEKNKTDLVRAETANPTAGNKKYRVDIDMELEKLFVGVQTLVCLFMPARDRIAENMQAEA